MRRAFGLRRDDNTRLRRQFASLRLLSTPTGFADLEPHSPPIMDQNHVGSCVAHAVPAASITTMRAQGNTLGFELHSPRWAYSTALCLDRSDDNPSTPIGRLPPLRDVGTMVLTVVDVERHWGVIPMGPCVEVDGAVVNSDCSLGNYSREPDLLELSLASRKLLVGAYQIPLGQGLELATQLTLDAGIAVAIGGWVDSKTFLPHRSDSPPIGKQDPWDVDGGAHCTYLVGYREINGSVVYRLRNSWGTSWGDKGCAWVTGAFLRSCWEAWAMAVDVRSSR